MLVIWWSGSPSECFKCKKSITPECWLLRITDCHEEGWLLQLVCHQLNLFCRSLNSLELHTQQSRVNGTDFDGTDLQQSID